MTVHACALALLVLSMTSSLHLCRPLAAQQDAAAVQIAVTAVRNGVHMISGGGGNIAVFLGQDGVFLVDAGLPNLAEPVLSAVRDLARREASDPDLAYLVNTHWHFDHAGGNERLATAGAVIVAHENVLRLLSEDQVMAALGNRHIAAADPAARPRLTFNDRVNLRWNGDLIHVVHIPDAHSNGDVVVHFRDANVIHTGDIFFNGTYPYIDVDFGGHIGGMVSAVEEVLAHSNDAALFIPGHGPVADRDDLLAYRDMLATVRDRIQVMIDRGMEREEVIAAKPTSDLDAEWSGGRSADSWVGLVYDGIVRHR